MTVIVTVTDSPWATVTVTQPCSLRLSAAGVTPVTGTVPPASGRRRGRRVGPSTGEPGSHGHGLGAAGSLASPASRVRVDSAAKIIGRGDRAAVAARAAAAAVPPLRAAERPCAGPGRADSPAAGPRARQRAGDSELDALKTGVRP